MNCAYHVERPVQGVCSTCGRPICDECLVNLSGQIHCKGCIEQKMRKPAREINGFVRFVLSVFPGLGHLYMGLFQRGFQFMVGVVLGSFLTGMLFDDLLGLFIPALIFFSIFDAREIHLRLDQGLEVEDKGFVDTKTLKFDWNNRYIGYVLIGIGALALYNTLLNDFLRLIFDTSVYYRIAGSIRGMTMGALAIGAGVWLLNRNNGQK